MTHRKEVFQAKVLQRLYPAAPTSEKETSPPHIVEALAKKTHVKRKATQNDTAAGVAANPRARMYTVLPPPADYEEKHTEGPVTLSQLESVNSAKDPAEESVNESNDELDQDQEREEYKRKRKRRKRKPTLPEASGRDGAGVGESRTVAEGGESISRNKKRKLKKKRHKEKMLSMGEVPRAAALVFTYQKDGEEEEEEEEDNERRATEVSDFLRTTLEIYLSESKLHGDELSLLSGAVGDLLSRISGGGRAVLNSVLKQLCSLKALVQQKEAGKLEEALEELRGGSSMSAEETAAVVSLFQYWITDVLPMRADKTTEPSTTETVRHGETEAPADGVLLSPPS